MPPSTPTIGVRDVLQHMEVEPGLYVVGSFERRVTLYSQQVRALNLVYALHEQKRLSAGSAVAVIGGGIAGLTAAAGAARLGCNVTLLEQHDVLMPMIRGNHTRWIHPHLYDWPAEGSEREDAGLPLLDWKAALAHEVVEQIEQAWRSLPEHRRITVHCNVKSTDPRAGRVSWNAKRFHNEAFDAVIVAVGFGLERKIDEVPWVSYWRDDDLHQSSPTGHARYLISGCGDGGLIDLLRVRLRDFKHEDIAALLALVPDDVKATLVPIDEDARRDAHPDAHPAMFLFRHYNALDLPTLDEEIKARLRGNTTAVLNARDEVPFTLNASIANRLLMSRLLRLGDVEYRQGELVCSRIGDVYEVRFPTGAPERFNRVIARHGPSPRALEDSFPGIWQKATAIRARNKLDQTRRPIYGDAFGPGALPKPALASAPPTTTAAGAPAATTSQPAALPTAAPPATAHAAPPPVATLTTAPALPPPAGTPAAPPPAETPAATAVSAPASLPPARTPATPTSAGTPVQPRPKLDRVVWCLRSQLNQSLMARRVELRDAIEKSRVSLRFELPQGTDKVTWPSCFHGDATREDHLRAFVWTGHGNGLGEDLVRLFDDGTIVFERRSPPPAQQAEVVVVDFNVLALDTLAFVRLSSATYARTAKSAGTSIAAPYTIELTLDLPEDHRRIIALFRSQDAYVRPRDLMRVARIRKPRVVTSRLVPTIAAERRDPVADALVTLLGGVADEFDLENNDPFSSDAKELQLDEKSLRELVPHTLVK